MTDTLVHPALTAIIPTLEYIPPVPTGAWRMRVVPDLVAAESLLDHLEMCGFAQTELVTLDEAFAVRWR